MCKVCAEFDQMKADGFADKLVNMLNNGALSLMVSIGHRTGLFDAMHQRPPVSSEEIATEAGLHERYVREWLGAMVTGDIVNTNEDGNRFFLPEEHASFLTRSAGADNIGVFAQYIPLLSQVEERVIESFKNGGGVNYEEYGRFHDVMAEDSGQSILHNLFTDILPLIPNIMDKLEGGIEVLDVGCGSGKALIMMAKKFPNSRFTGYDLCREPIAKAQADVESNGLKNITFEQKDLTYSQPEKQFDLITAFDAIHDQASPDKVLADVYSTLKKGGYFLMQDIDGSSNIANNVDHPIGTLLYTLSCMHCMTVSLAQNGMGLGAMWGVEKAQEMLQSAGFKDIDIHRLEHDFQNCYYVVRK